MTTAAMSKGFFEFVKSIGEAKSKQEEDRIIENELHVLKAKMAGRNVANRQMREYLIRMVYVEMLGHDASFGHIHGVKLTRARKLVDKRVGYMACSLCLHKDHELMLLLVGGLQTDLQSQNQLEVATALIVACKLINEDAIPALLPLVLKLLGHSEASIRKKAIMTIQRFYELNDGCITDTPEKAKRMLCDKDPSVMAASLHLLFDLIEKDVNAYKDLVSSFVSILKQIIEHRLPKDYDYHRMPAPWAQIKLLQILAILGTADKGASEGMYEVLHEVMRRADIGINVGYAIIYECVRTVTIIFPNPHLLAEAAKCTSRFITSENHNLKYLGINALASIVQVQPQAANEHQMVVIDCLEDKDETLRRKTLDLLYRMTNEHNVNVICTKLIGSLKDSVDVYLRQELIDKITSLAEKFAPDTIWFIETMSEVFEMGADLVKPQFAHNFIHELADGIQTNMEDDESEEDIAQYAADFFFELLDKSRIPNILLKVIAWVLGEYGQHATGQSVHDDEDSDENKEADVDVMEVIRRLWEIVEKQGEDSETRQWAMSATCKLCRHLDTVPQEVEDIVNKYTTSVNSELQQLSHELIELTKERSTMLKVYSNASITDTIRVDPKLKFLDSFVQKQLDNGGRQYSPPNSSDQMYGGGHGPRPEVALQTEHRQVGDKKGSLITMKPVAEQPTAGIGHAFPQQSTKHSDNEETDEVDLRGRAKSNVWGPKGYNDPASPDDDGVAAARGATEQDGGTFKVTTIAPANVQRGVIQREQTPPAPTQQLPARLQAQKSEKQLLAESIFGGGGLMGGGGGSTGRGKGRKGKGKAKRKVPKKRKNQRARKSAQQTAVAAASNNNNANNTDDSKENEMNLHPPAPQEVDLLSFGADVTNQQGNGQQNGQNESKTNATVQSGGDDLLDFLGGMQLEPQASQQQQQTTQSTGIGDPMADLLSDLGNSQQAVSGQPQQGGGLDLDFFGGLGNNQSNSNNLNNMNNQNHDSSNLMGGVGNGLNSLISSASVARGYNANNLKSIKYKLDTFPKSHDTDQMITSDSSLQVSYFKIYKQQQTNLCIFVSNLTNNPVSSVMVGATAANNNANIHFVYDLGNSVPKPKAKNVYTGIISQLNGNETACQIINFGAANPVNMMVPCKVNVSVQYQGGNNNNSRLNGQIEIAGHDLVRPYMMNTQEFGSYWLKLSGAEMKFDKRGSVNNVQSYVNLITKLQFHHIQTIQSECIAAGQITSVTNVNVGVPCLVHAKCENGQFTVLVRSSVPRISQAIAMDLSRAMS